jgi:hypothetical protein
MSSKFIMAFNFLIIFIMSAHSCMHKYVYDYSNFGWDYRGIPFKICKTCITAEKFFCFSHGHYILMCELHAV